jgi:hypothetical protein
MAYSVYKGATDISDHVVSCPPIPLVETTHDNQVTLPSMSLGVIWNAVSYTKGDYIYFKKDSTAFAWFVIDSIQENYEENTLTLELVDPLYLLKDYYASELIAEEYLAAITAGDYDGSFNKRFYWSDSSANPHRINFVTLSHYIKTAIVKAGIVADGSKIDASAIYGAIYSGFVYWDPVNDTEKEITLEELCFQPSQIKYAKKLDGSEDRWEGATLLDVVLYALQVMNCRIKYSGTSVVICQRETGTGPDDDDLYSYQSSSWLNSFDLVKVGITYGVTAGALYGFSYYEAGTPSAGSMSIETWKHPEAGPEGVKPREKSYALMNHSPVHYRKVLEDVGYCYEMHLEAYELGSEAQQDYIFAKQYAKMLHDRFPATGVIETIQTADDMTVWTERPALKKSLDIPQRSCGMEY